MNWIAYEDWIGDRKHSVSGNVLVCPEVFSPQLSNTRHILAYLPVSYVTSTERYPVLYMHDGQNLFDRRTSAIGEWCVDETMERLATEGYEAIVIGIPHLGEERVHELSPYACELSGSLGLGQQYLDFITDTVKVIVDASFKTLPDSSNTGIMGSSMGGLISLFAGLRQPETFGFCGAMSPALWFGEYGIYAALDDAVQLPDRVYIDTGIAEIDVDRKSSLSTRAYERRAQESLGAGAPYTSAQLSELWVDDVRELHKQLESHSHRPSALRFVEAPAKHDEAAWARRFPDAARFLLPTQLEFRV